MIFLNSVSSNEVILGLFCNQAECVFQHAGLFSAVQRFSKISLCYRKKTAANRSCNDMRVMPMLINYSFKDHLLPDPLCQSFSFCCRHRSAEQEKAGLGQRFGRRGVGWDAIQGPSDAHRDKEAALITQKHRHAVMCMKTASTVYKPAETSNNTLDSHSKSSPTNLKSVFTKRVMLCWRILWNFGSLDKTRQSK